MGRAHDDGFEPSPILRGRGDLVEPAIQLFTASMLNHRQFLLMAAGPSFGRVRGLSDRSGSLVSCGQRTTAVQWTGT
jgi:hypothetical protein